MSTPDGVVIPFSTEKQRRLPVHECAGCMKLEAEKEALHVQTLEMATDMDGLQRELKRKRREVSRLEGEIARMVRGPDSPTHEIATRIGDFWKAQTGHKRSNFDVPREKAVLHGLHLAAAIYPEECEKDETFAAKVVCCAIIGCARMGFTDPKTRVKHDEIKMICRDSEMFEKNLRRYFVYMAQTGRQPVIPALDEER